jgi:hypothetical protein
MDYNLQAYVPIPTAGAVPVKNVSTRRDMDISAKWMDILGMDITGSLTEFAEGASYKAEITLRARAGWSFDPAVSFAYPMGTVADPPAANTAADTRIFRVTYRPTAASQAITGEDLKSYIPKPETGATPVASFSAPRYTGTLEWMEGAGSISGDVFLPLTGYTVVATLRAGPGYTFNGIPEKPVANLEVPGVFRYSQSEGLIHGAGRGSEIEVIVKFGNTGPAPVNYVTDYDLQHYVPIPAKDAAPVKIIDRPELDGTVVWKDASDLDITGSLISFGDGITYKAEITLKAKAGWAFSGTSFKYPDGTTDVQPGDNTAPDVRALSRVTYKAVISPTVITAGDLSGYIPAPVTGVFPVKSFDASGAGYGGILSWEYKDGPYWTGMPGGYFQPGMKYKAKLTLHAAGGYTFSGMAGNFSYSGGGVSMSGGTISGSESSIEGIELEFPVTGKLPVTDLELTVKVPQPVRGAAPVRNVVSFQYESKSGMSWAPNPDGGIFQSGISYKATVTLAAASGYTFAGLAPPLPGSPGFSHGGSGVTVFPTSGANEAEINLAIEFPATTANTPVSDTDLTARIPAPVIGNTPKGTFSGSQYSGTLAWNPNDSSFKSNTAYTARVTLSPAFGYTLDGLGPGAFTHSGADTAVTPRNPSFAADLVTIVFPAIVECSFGRSNLVNNALDQMQAAAAAPWAAINLSPGTEELAVGTAVLTAGTTAPAAVTINGGGRVLRVEDGTTGSPLITVDGISLTLTNITIRGRGTGSSDPNLNAPLIKVKNNGTLILGSGAILEDNKNNASSNDNKGAVQVASGSFLVMDAGSAIRNNKTSSNYSGGGVFVDGGTFTMNGGVLSGNTAAGMSSGGGVHVVGGGKFDMGGGEISGNTAAGGGSGGGVSLYNTSQVFTMSGGRISGNSATQGTSGGGVYVNTNGIFLMTGGEISGNSAAQGTSGGGVNAHDGTFTMNGGEISGNTSAGNNSGGGVRVISTYVLAQPALLINGGVISGNTATGGDSGGGVFVRNGPFTMKGGKISGNRAGNTSQYAYSGGGVRIEGAGGIFTMSGDGEISGNTAAGDKSGGGVHIFYSTFTMGGGGVISGNTAEGADSGGGVYVYYGRAFFMTGGGISGNTAEGGNSGGGVSYIHNSTSNLFIMSGGQIYDNTAEGAGSGGGVHLPDTAFFTMSGGQIYDNTAGGVDSGGGVNVVGGGKFTMNSGGLSGNIAGGANSGGAVRIYKSGAASPTFSMTGGTIMGNRATAGSSQPGVKNVSGIYENSGGIVMDTSDAITTP